MAGDRRRIRARMEVGAIRGEIREVTQRTTPLRGESNSGVSFVFEGVRFTAARVAEVVDQVSQEVRWPGGSKFAAFSLSGACVGPETPMIKTVRIDHVGALHTHVTENVDRVLELLGNGRLKKSQAARNVVRQMMMKRTLD